MNSFIPWVGGKGKLLWIINKLMPDRYTRFIDVFGGSGTVTMCRPIQRGCIEIYNDFNSNLTNLFCCVKNRPMALLAELGFLPLNTRDDFNVLYKFFSKGEFTDDYLQEEMDLTEVYLKPPDAEAIRALMLERAPRGSIRRAADFFKLIRYSFSGGAKSFGGKPCDIRRFFHLIWECSRRLANVIVENKDFEEVIRQYDRAGAVIYCDPPYYKAESCYEVEFPPEDHQRLHDVLVTCEGYFIVSYNYQDYICEIYQDCYIFRTSRPNSMSQTAGSEYEEIVITNYDPRKACWQLSIITPLHADPAYLEADDLVRIQDGAKEPGKTPDADVLLHQKIYDKNPKIGAIAFAQPVHSMVFAVTDMPFDTRTIPESYILLRDVKRIPFEAAYQNLDDVADEFDNAHPVLLIENKSVMVTGASMLQVFDRLEVMEMTAASILDAQALGTIAHIPSDEIAALKTAFHLED